ncbi:MAG: hypothetical protein JRN68_05355 [Nitrososphaerota archaeon]|nr:hypothetical protein [Nitrososphaerota archaeon]
MQNEQSRRRPTGKYWVPVAILIGVVLGFFLSLTVPPLPYNEFVFGIHYFDWSYFAFHIILSTVAIALLVALFVVYIRIYSETRANFALGLIIVLGALLLQSLLTYPLLLAEPREFWTIPGASFDSADILLIVAYAVFLYLSLE